MPEFSTLRYFKYAHLPPELQRISEPFYLLAMRMMDELGATGDPAEIAAGLRKLLEAKDCFVRAKLPREVGLPIVPGLQGDTPSR